MDTISNTVWQRRGSSIVFDHASLASFIEDGSVVSLRQMLAWFNNPPQSPPVSGRTILVSGLETVIETLEPQEAEDFLCHRVRPLLMFLQSRWTDCGVVFGFSSHPKSFVETSFEEEVLFRRRDRKKVNLSGALWDGSATVNMKRVVREGDKPEEEVIIGYYVARIS